MSENTAVQKPLPSLKEGREFMARIQAGETLVIKGEPWVSRMSGNTHQSVSIIRRGVARPDSIVDENDYNILRYQEGDGNGWTLRLFVSNLRFALRKAHSVEWS